MVQCGPTGLLSEIGFSISLIRRNGDVVTEVL
jgi:hypothetical protein